VKQVKLKVRLQASLKAKNIGTIYFHTIING